MVTLTPLHLKQAGFSDDSIIHWINNQRPLLKKAGFSDMEINKAYGLKEVKSNVLTDNDMDVDASLLNNQVTEPFPDNVETINKDNTSNIDKSQSTINKEIIENQENQTEFLKLSKEDQNIIKNKVLEAYEKFKGDNEGRIGFIDSWLNDHFPNVNYNDIKQENEIKLMSSALNEDQTKKLSDLEARDILEGNVGWNADTNRFTYSKENEELLRPERIKKKEEQLIEEFKEKKKLYILNTPLTTGQETRGIMKWAVNYYGWNEQELETWNNYISFISALESDNRNIYSPDGSAKGLFQFKDASLVDALDRFLATQRSMNPDYVTPTWVEEAYLHKDGTALTPDQQRAVTMANFFQISYNKILNRDGTDELIKKIVQGDIEAMKALYKDYHHADWKINVEETGEGDAYWEVQENAKLDKRMEDHFKWWGTTEVGYMNPEIAMLPSDWVFQDGWLGKLDSLLSYYAGGQGNQNVFKTGYSQSVIGMFDQYIEWSLDHPESSGLEKDDMMKEIFMYQGQTFHKDIIQSAITLGADIIPMGVGCLAVAGGTTAITGGFAAPAAPVTCMAGAFALPEVLRHSFTEAMIDGKVNNFEEYMDHLIDIKTAVVGGKMAFLGAATSVTGLTTQFATKSMIGTGNLSKTVVGKSAPTIARLSSEIYVMTELGARMNGHTPTMRDFAHTAVLIFGFHATIGQVKNLINIYKDHAITPDTILMITDQRPEVKDQLFRNEIPDFILDAQKKYLQGLEETSEIKLIEPPKYQVSEKININVSGTEQGIIVGREVIGGESVLLVKNSQGKTIPILESQARKLDPANNNLKVEIKEDSIEGKKAKINIEILEKKLKIVEEKKAKFVKEKEKKDVEVKDELLDIPTFLRQQAEKIKEKPEKKVPSETDKLLETLLEKIEKLESEIKDPNTPKERLKEIAEEQKSVREQLESIDKEVPKDEIPIEKDSEQILNKIINDLKLEIEKENEKLITEKSGKLDLIINDALPVDKVETGSKSRKNSFEVKQKSGEYDIDIIEVKKEGNEIINKDGSQFKSTIVQALNDLNKNSRKEKIVSEDGKVSSDGKLLVVNKYYRNIEKEFNKKNKKGENVWDKRDGYNFKTGKELIDKVFKGLNAKYKKISVVFAKKKGDYDYPDVLIGKIGKKFVQFSRKAYNQLSVFEEGGVKKKAKIMAKDDGSAIVFLHPETNNVVALLMPMRLDSRLKTQAESYWRDHADKGNSGGFHYERGSRDGETAGMPIEPYEFTEFPKGSKADYKKLFENSQTIGFWDIVTLVESLLKKLPELKENLGSGTLGVFQHLKKFDKNKPINEQAKVIVKRELQANPERFLMTLAHELGHLIDFVPKMDMAKGNILGHIANLHKYMKKWIDGKNDGAKPLSKAELNKFKKEAEIEAKKLERETDTEIKKLEITPESVLKIFTDPKAREFINKEFYEAFVRLSSALKKLIVKDAMKGLMSHHIKAIADKINGKKVDPKLDAEAQRIFAEKVEKELKNRGLVNLEMILQELKALSMKWKPFNRTTESKGFVKYRDSAVELMADFMMAWLLRPQWTKINAPRTFELWKYHIENRPEVKELYIQIQNRLNSSKNVLDAMKAEETMNMFRNNQKKVVEEVKRISTLKKLSEKSDWLDEIWDSFHWILSSLKLDSQRGNSTLAKDLKYYIEHYRYRAAELSEYKKLFVHQIEKQLNKFSYNKENLGYMLLLRNLANSKQRENKITWKFYKLEKSLEKKLKAEEGDIVGMYERYANEHPELARISNEFLQMRKDFVVKTVLEYDVFDAKLKKQLVDNFEYITFMPVDIMISRFDKIGIHSFASKTVKETIGTFKEFVNPVDATLAKDMVLLTEMRRQNLYHHIVEFLLKNEKNVKKIKSDLHVIHKPKYISKGKLEQPMQGLKRIFYMRNGVIKAMDIHKNTADAIHGNPLYTYSIIKKMNSVFSVYRAIFTEHNPLFWIWNWGFRDMRNSLIMLPSGGKWKTTAKGQQILIPKKGHKFLLYNMSYVLEVFKALSPALKSLYGTGTAVTQFMSKHGYLIAPEEGYRTQAGMGKFRLELNEDAMMLKKLIFEQYESQGKFGWLWENTTGRYLYHSAMIARALERSHKIAGFNVMKKQIEKGELDMTMPELMQFVQSKIGSPNFLRQGKANPIINNLILFFNANKEGVRAGIEGFKTDPYGVGGRFFAWSLAPKMLEKYILLGGLGTAYALLMNSVPEHDRNNFNVVVIGETPDNRPVYLRFPMDQTSQWITSLWSMSFDEAFGFHKAKSQAQKIKMWWDAVTQGIPKSNPFVEQILNNIRAVTGDDVKDRFNRDIIDPLVMKLDMTERSWVKTRELVKWNWNTYGAKWVYKFKAKFKDEIISEYEEMTGFPLVDQLISRFLKVGDHPVMDEYYDIKNIEKSLYNTQQYDLREGIDKLLDGRGNELTDSEKQAMIMNPSFAQNTYFMEQLCNAAECGELIKEFINADKKERAMLLQAIINVTEQNPNYEIKFKK